MRRKLVGWGLTLLLALTCVTLLLLLTYNSPSSPWSRLIVLLLGVIAGACAVGLVARLHALSKSMLIIAASIVAIFGCVGAIWPIIQPQNDPPSPETLHARAGRVNLKRISVTQGVSLKDEDATFHGKITYGDQKVDQLLKVEIAGDFAVDKKYATSMELTLIDALTNKSLDVTATGTDCQVGPTWVCYVAISNYCYPCNKYIYGIRYFVRATYHDYGPFVNGVGSMKYDTTMDVIDSSVATFQKATIDVVTGLPLSDS